jgi:5-formyltetrahydrofolate cyclo-ligase
MKIAKTDLRQQCHKIREGLSPEQVRMSSQAVCAHLNSWPTFQQANTVLGFLAFRNEIDLSQLFERWPNKHWLMPRVVAGSELAPGQRSYLMLHSYDPTRLRRHRFGMLEPEPSLPSIHPGQVEVVLVPGVAFDPKGGRIGFGGGFYDRLLPLAHEAIRVGVTYEELVLESVPMEPWDCRVHWLVTSAGMTRIKQT